MLTVNSYSQFDTCGPINRKIINTVIEIQKGNEVGSGFLVYMGGKKLLVTNKHMIGNWSPVDSLICNDSIFIFPYSTINSGASFLKVGINIATHGIPIPFKVKTHINPKIDIAVIDIGSDINKLSLDNTDFIDTTYFLTLDKAKSVLTYGSQVFTIGYPAGVKVFKTNQAIVKSGYLASSMDGNLVMEQTWQNRKGMVIKTLTDGKIFIVDGLIIPGNSGGPVVTSQEIVWFKIDGQLKHLQNVANYFIGMVSNVYNNTGLSTIFASDNILEVVRQFK